MSIFDNQVGESLLPQGGEGLFAKKDLAAREVASLYNGIKVKTGTYASEHLPRLPILKERKKLVYAFFARSDYRIRLNGDWDMDIPKVAGTTLAEFFVNTIITLFT